MFWHGGAMQLSAANLLIASQQIARGQPSRDAQAQFAAALAKEKAAGAATAFEPMEFKPAAAEAQPGLPVSPEPSARPHGQSRTLGANLDIRV
jgi:hypothetical protein